MLKSMIRSFSCTNENLSVEKQGQEHSGNTDKCQHKAFNAVFFFVSQINDRTGGRYAKRDKDCQQFRHCIRNLTIHSNLNYHNIKKKEPGTYPQSNSNNN